MEIHFAEKQLEISRDFKEKNEEILGYLQKEEKIELIELADDKCYISFKNFTGIIEIDEKEKYLVVSKKIAEKFKLVNENAEKEYLNKFKNFLNYILKELTKEKLLFTLNLLSYPVDEGKPNSSLIFKILLLLTKKEELINSIHLILSNPHKILTEYETYKPLNEVSYVDENILIDIITHPENLYKVENGIINNQYSLLKVLQYETEETFDTLENRFIKHFLKELRFFLDTEAKELLEIEDLRNIKDEIEYCLQSDVFSEVGDLNYFPSNSQVLMKKAGYREIFQIYRYFHLSFIPKFSQDLDMAFSLKDMATLWEYYVLIELLKHLKEKFGNYKITEDFKERKKGKTIYEKAEFKFEKGLILYFQLTKRSYSGLEFRPDFLIEYEGKKYIFDAKFRIFEDNKKDILQNMHYYKDGLNAKFAIAVCFGDNTKGKFYFKKTNKSEEIKLEDFTNFISCRILNGVCKDFDGVGYINLKLDFNGGQN